MKNPAKDSAFQLEQPSQKRLTFADANKHAITEWVQSLPVADLSASTKLLYNALKEINQLIAPPAIRLELINAIRPHLFLSLERLSKHFLNQPVQLPDRPEKIANLYLNVLSDLTKGYLLAVEQSQAKMGALLKKPVMEFIQSAYYALDAMQHQMLCRFQLYRVDEPGFWLQIHRLYHLVHTYKLNTRALHLADANADLTLDNKYCEILLWGSIKANQLRQDDIRRLIPLVHYWAHDVSLKIPEDNAASLLIEPSADHGPVFQRFFQGSRSANCRMLDTHALINKLKELRDPLLNNSIKLPENLINHLILAWGVASDRTFMRLESNSQLTMCIGLTTTHFFVADQTPFNQLVLGNDDQSDEPSDADLPLTLQDENTPPPQAGVDPRFLSRELTTGKDAADVWNETLFGTANDKLRNKEQQAKVEMESIVYHMRSGLTQTSAQTTQYNAYDVNIINMSPGGYCLGWEDVAPAAVKAGEIIGIKTDLYKHWHIGAIRWVKQFDSKKLRVGVELISPSATAFGARRLNESGDNDTAFLRVLYLPEVTANGQPATLVTPTLTFREGQHLVLVKKGREIPVVLDKLMSSSGSYSQFSFSLCKPLAEHAASGNMTDHQSADEQKSDKGSVWELL